MDKNSLEARKTELQQEAEKVAAQYNQLSGAIALINELIGKVKEAVDGKDTNGRGSSPKSIASNTNTSTTT